MKSTTNAKPEAEAFAATIKEVEYGSPLYFEMVRLFCREMRKAADHGRICTPERMALLYPIFREINVEMEEIDAECTKWNNKKGVK